jgi:hypothetical protein
MWPFRVNSLEVGAFCTPFVNVLERKSNVTCPPLISFLVGWHDQGLLTYS